MPRTSTDERSIVGPARSPRRPAVDRVVRSGAGTTARAGERTTAHPRIRQAGLAPASVLVLSISLLLANASLLPAGEWPQFRGPSGLGATSDTELPLTWSESENLKWKTELPGPGSSSPIVCGDRIFVTCYSGYGTERGDSGNIEDLQRHLLCLERNDGSVIWSRVVKAEMPEDPFSGLGIPEHGYATNTPVTDGQRVYVFFGKTGVLAFDLEGNQLWKADVGRESSNRRWGTAASPILYKQMVIVNASEESQSIRALDKMTGQEVWKAEGTALELTYATPAIVDLDDGRRELVIGVPFEVWGLDPDTGKLNWYAETSVQGNVAPSPIAKDGIVYVMGGFPGTATVAIRAGGKDDVTGTHVLWTSRDSSYVPSPVLHEGNLYWVNDQGYAFCVDAATGERRYRERLSEGPGGMGRGKPFYASVVLADDRLYAVSRRGGTYVLAAKPEFGLLAHNRLPSDQSDFNASPAISDGQIFLRSNRFLYCIQGP